MPRSLLSFFGLAFPALVLLLATRGCSSVGGPPAAGQDAQATQDAVATDAAASLDVASSDVPSTNDGAVSWCMQPSPPPRDLPSGWKLWEPFNACCGFY